MYCVDLNIDLPILTTNLDPTEFLKSRPSWANNVNTNRQLAKHFQLDYETEITQKIKDFFDQHNFYIELVEIFYLFPGDVMSIHTDRSAPGDFVKVNWIYGGTDSVMKWYNVKSDTQSTAPLYTTPINSPSLQYKPWEVELAHEQAVGCPSLVQVGCPHSVVNGPEERFCASLVFKHKSTKTRVTMTEALSVFKKYIK